MSNCRPAVVVAAILLAGPEAALRAQEEEPEEIFREAIEVTEVLLDVVVTDKNDRIILGLGPDDFVVAEQREIVTLDAVTFYSSKRLLESSDVLARRDLAVDVVPQDRFFVLFVQEQRSDSAARRNPLVRQRAAGQQIVRWLLEEAQPADRMAVVSFSRGLKIHQDFTLDREALVDAVEGAARGRDPARVPPARSKKVAGDPAALDTLSAGRELRRSTPNVYRALQQVARALARVPGRKNLIFLGQGFGDLGTFGNYQPQLSRFNPTLEALNDANVAVYTIDVSAPGVEHSLRPSLRDLASQTGGRFFYDDLKFTGALREISDLTSGYYLLSYRSRRPAGESGYQRVRIGTRSPEFRIYARQGYLYGPDPAP